MIVQYICMYTHLPTLTRDFVSLYLSGWDEVWAHTWSVCQSHWCVCVCLCCNACRPIAGERKVCVWSLSSSALFGTVLRTLCLSVSTPRMGPWLLLTLALRLGRESTPRYLMSVACGVMNGIKYFSWDSEDLGSWCVWWWISQVHRDTAVLGSHIHLCCWRHQ